MEARVKAIQNGQASEMIWALQHKAVFTAGTSANRQELLDSLGFPVHQTGRGGRFTYHGPGQLVVYVMLNLIKRQLELRKFITTLETWIINSLKGVDIKAEQRSDRIGLWVINPNQTEDKIAALGIRISRGVSWHGFSVNISPDLNHFKGIIPCGLREYGVTSCAQLKKSLALKDFYQLLKITCPFR